MNDFAQPTMLPPAPSARRRIFYRVGQFLQGVTASVSADERRRLAAWLTPEGQALFARMPADAQRHSLNVLSTLHKAGYEQPDLTAAALLHDVGKIAADEAGVRLQLWMRGPLVLAAAVAPAALARQAAADPQRGWRYAIHVQLDHPAIGAKLASDAGCSDLTCWLIAHHQDKTPPTADDRSALLAALQQADDMN